MCTVVWVVCVLRLTTADMFDSCRMQLRRFWVALYAASLAAAAQNVSTLLCPCQKEWDFYGRLWNDCVDFSEGSWCFVDTKALNPSGGLCRFNFDDTTNISWNFCNKNKTDCYDGTTGPTFDQNPSQYGVCRVNATSSWQNDCVVG